VYCVKFKRSALTRQTISQSAEGRLDSLAAIFPTATKSAANVLALYLPPPDVSLARSLNCECQSGRPLEFVFSLVRGSLGFATVAKMQCHTTDVTQLHFNHPQRTDQLQHINMKMFFSAAVFLLPNAYVSLH
jgi:hypothetical protein